VYKDVLSITHVLAELQSNDGFIEILSARYKEVDRFEAGAWEEGGYEGVFIGLNSVQ